MSKKQPKIDQIFKRQSQAEIDKDVDVSMRTDNDRAQPSEANITVDESMRTVDESEPTYSIPSEYENDFGVLVDKVIKNGLSSIEPAQKLHYLEKFYVPPPNFKFPSVKKQEKGRVFNVSLKHNHFSKPEFKWLAFSPSKGGLFCK